LASLALVAACGPSSNHGDDTGCPGADLQTDPQNCGTCGHVCNSGLTCQQGACAVESCNPGDSRACYDGVAGSEGVGPCHGGMQTCNPTGSWGLCTGEVVPIGEICGNGTDDNCNNMVDENTDTDGDGYSTCDGDCCDSTADGCSDPKLVNPGAFEAPGNNLDDDCDGMIDNTVAATCDTGLASNSTNAMDFAKAIDICQVATAGDKKWGVLDAKFSFTDGSGAPDAQGRAIRPKFGTNVVPKAGSSLAILSTGVAAAVGDTNPAYVAGDTTTHGTESSPFPPDFYSANGNNLPNAPGCPAPSGANANDPEMLTMHIRVPSNAKSFSLNSNFFSYEFPEYTCSPYNDFFVILLDSTYAGSPANPSDKNLAFYQNASMMKYPVGVNLAFGNTGLFTQCVNGMTGCAGLGLFPMGSISTCMGTTDLAGTGFDGANSGQCDSNSLQGGGTGWLETSGNVVGGETITLRIAIWDTSDQALDSTAVIDNFRWSVDAADPGTVIGKQAPSADGVSVFAPLAP
jgi:hypothetical protein